MLAGRVSDPAYYMKGGGMWRRLAGMAGLAMCLASCGRSVVAPECHTAPVVVTVGDTLPHPVTVCPRMVPR